MGAFEDNGGGVNMNGILLATDIKISDKLKFLYSFSLFTSSFYDQYVGSGEIKVINRNETIHRIGLKYKLGKAK